MNKLSIVKVENVYLAELRYYNSERNGIELSSPLSYSFLVKVDDNFVNPFDIYENYPVYTRVPYSNTTIDGEDYGSKIAHLYGSEDSGACYLIDINDKFYDNMFGDIPVEYLEEFMFNSKLYFKDRKELLTTMFPFSKIQLLKRIKLDRENEKKMNEFFDERNCKMVQIK